LEVKEILMQEHRNILQKLTKEEIDKIVEELKKAA